MQGLRFYEIDEGGEKNPFGKEYEGSSRLLLNAYVSLIHTFNATAELFLKGDVESVGTFQSLAYSLFAKTFASRAGVSDLSQVLPRGKDSFQAHILAYDSMGNVVPLFSENGVAGGIEKKLVVIRLQASHIHDSHSGKDLGSVVFADTYFQLDLA